MKYLRKKDLYELLVMIILIFAGGMYYVLKKTSITKTDSTSISVTDSLILKNFEKEIYEDSIRRIKKFDNSIKKQTFYFNPNTCDSIVFIQLGLPYWVASNALKYRRAGGIWKSPKDFHRLYGLTNKDFVRLYPYIIIPKIVKDSLENEHKFSYHQEKFKEVQTLNLNTVDTITLKKIPGIGSFYARKICQYRERLGGYISISQLKEIDDLPLDIQKWFFVSSYPIKKISINRATFKELIRHPYLNYEQTVDIVTYIRKYGVIQSWSDLSLSKHFSQKDIERLTPYISFSQ